MTEFLTAAGQSKTLSQWETCSSCFNITVILLTNFAFYCHFVEQPLTDRNLSHDQITNYVNHRKIAVTSKIGARQKKHESVKF